MNIRTSTRQVGGVTIVDVSGRIVLGEESASLRDLIRDLSSQGRKQILLNLSAVDHFDSAGLGSLVGSSASVRKQGGELKLLDLPDKIVGIMQITKLYTVFEILKGEAAGVKSFSQSTGAVTP
jgi:anti-sigma B factor antagonist